MNVMFRRFFSIAEILPQKSVFLLGPRQTGKSTYLRASFPESTVIDLLDSATFRELSATPERLHMRSPKPELVIIDEVQKCPILLNEVHRLISLDKRWRFILTGSSARKLRRGGVNLLGGRARRQTFHPITSQEITTHPGKKLHWLQLLSFGGLPQVLLSEHPKEELSDYIALYLKEEIQAEAFVRDLGRFSRFLDVAATANGEQVIFSSIASDAAIPARTVREYFTILEDTLVGTLLPAFRKTSKRKAVAAAKFYFFDVGVAHALLHRVGVERGHDAFGRALEHLVYCELTAWISYKMPAVSLYYWRSTSQLEVDFVLEFPDGTIVGIEVKASGNIAPKHCRGLLALREEHPTMKMFIVADRSSPLWLDNDITVLPIEKFFEQLWNNMLTQR